MSKVPMFLDHLDDGRAAEVVRALFAARPAMAVALCEEGVPVLVEDLEHPWPHPSQDGARIASWHSVCTGLGDDPQVEVVTVAHSIDGIVGLTVRGPGLAAVEGTERHLLISRLDALVDGWSDDPERAAAVVQAAACEVRNALRNAGIGVVADGSRPFAATVGWGRALRGMDLAAWLERQREWSRETFGPGARAAGVVDHIRKELGEIERSPGDVLEWIDVAILAFDGALRAGHAPHVIVALMEEKSRLNRERNWPDWRTMPLNRAVEHNRGEEEGAAGTSAPAVAESPGMAIIRRMAERKGRPLSAEGVTPKAGT